MAKNSFEDLLATVKSEYREAIEAAAKEYPELKAGWLRQADYSRKMDEHRDLLEYAKQQKAWYEENMVQFEDGSVMTKRELELQRQLEEAKANAGKGDEMTAEQLRQQMEAAFAAKGFVDKETLQKEGSGLVTTLSEIVEARLKEVQQAAVNAAYIGGQFAQVALKHEKEFGEVPSQDDLFKFASEKGINNLNDAYEQWVAPLRKEREITAHKAEIEAARAEERAKTLQEVGMQSNSMPDDHSGANMTAMERLVFKQGAGGGEIDLDKIPFDGAGTSLAQAAARNWRPASK